MFRTSTPNEKLVEAQKDIAEWERAHLGKAVPKRLVDKLKAARWEYAQFLKRRN